MRSLRSDVNTRVWVRLIKDASRKHTTSGEQSYLDTRYSLLLNIYMTSPVRLGWFEPCLGLSFVLEQPFSPHRHVYKGHMNSKWKINHTIRRSQYKKQTNKHKTLSCWTTLLLILQLQRWFCSAHQNDTQDTRRKKRTKQSSDKKEKDVDCKNVSSISC